MAENERAPKLGSLLESYRGLRASGRIDLDMTFSEWLDKYWYVIAVQRSDLTRVVEVLDDVHKDTADGYRLKSTTRKSVEQAIVALTRIING